LHITAAAEVVVEAAQVVAAQPVEALAVLAAVVPVRLTQVLQSLNQRQAPVIPAAVAVAAPELAGEVQQLELPADQESSLFDIY
jgi:hypothetical protein